MATFQMFSVIKA